MNVWIKRGLRTALLTGGLLAVGSGIASADDSIAVTVPVTVTDNAIAVLGTSPGTTAPEITLPAVAGEVRADLGAATVSVPVAVGGNSADAAGLDVAQPASQPAEQPAPSGSGGSAVDADVPVTVAGNAVAVLGEATAGGSAPAPAAEGGASVADVDVPVTVCGTGVGVLGDATATCTAPTTAGTDTDGAVGDAPILDVDAPITACGTGLGVLGDTTATCTAAGTTDSGATDGGATDGGATDGGATDGGQVDPVGPTLAGQMRDTAAVPARSGLLLSGTAATTGSTVSTRMAATGNAATLGSGSASVSVSGSGSGSADVLAYTGADLALQVLGGLLALLLGLGLTVRRRDAALG